MLTEEDKRLLAAAEEIRKRRHAAKPSAPCPEPPRGGKAHWDFLLEEMKWMSNEFQK